MGNTARRRSERVRRERQRHLLIGGIIAATIVIGVVVAVSLATRSDSPSGPPLSAEGVRGKELAVTYGCTGCHGRSGEGVTGPAWQGLYGSTVALVDGSSVVADRAYLTESIVNPNAKQVRGFGAMPGESIPDADVQSIVQYIVELATPAAS